MTIREFISTINNTLNSVSPDINIPGEYIYWMGINSSKFIVKRETDNRKLFKNSTFFTKLECVEMEEISVQECGITLPCNKIMKSKKPIPEAFKTNFGSLLQVFNLTRDKDYKEVSITQYKNIKNQKYQAINTKYFWIENDYLYIPDVYVEAVIITGLFSDIQAVLLFNNSNNCISILDVEFPCPDYLLMPIIEATINQIFTSLKIPKDENSNLNSLIK